KPHMSSTSTARVRPNRRQMSPSMSASDSGCSLRASSIRQSSAASSPMARENTCILPLVIGRTGVRVGWVLAGAICLLAADARADKKKPGLFDIDTWKLPSTRERDFVNGNLAPHGMSLDPAVAPQGQSRAIRVRIYADRDYRGMVLRWQGKMRAQIQRINAVLGPAFNVHFEIESLRDWDKSHLGAALIGVMIDELAELDPAREVDLVIGLVTPLRGVATSVHSIGMARLLSRHFVLRGMDDEQEFRAFEREFKLISGEERQRLYEDRKA